MDAGNTSIDWAPNNRLCKIWILASLETAMNIDEIRSLIFGNPKNVTLLHQNNLNKNKKMIVFFMNFNSVNV